MQQSEIDILVKALREILAIEDQMVGGDWEEISCARMIAEVALKKVGIDTTPPVGYQIWWGVGGNMQLLDGLVYKSKELALYDASCVKSTTEVRPLYYKV